MAPPGQRNQPPTPLPLQGVGANPTQDVPWIGSRRGFYNILEAATEPTLAATIHPTSTKMKVGTAPPANPAGGAGHPKQGPADRTIDQDEG